MGVALHEGSSLYYSLLHLPADAHRRVLLRLRMVRTLGETLHDVSEPQVARQKLQWWHEDIERLLQGAPRHPALIGPARDLAGQAEARQACVALLDATGELRLETQATEAIRHDLLRRQTRARIQLVLHAATDNAHWLDDSETITDQLAGAHGEMDQLLQLPRLLHRGFAVFSDACYRRHDLTPAALMQRIAVARSVVPLQHPEFGLSDEQETSAGTAADTGTETGIETGTGTAHDADVLARAVSLYRAATRHALHGFEQARADTPLPAGDLHREALPVLILTALRERQCRLWLRRSPELLRERVSISPLRKLYITWCCRRAAG